MGEEWKFPTVALLAFYGRDALRRLMKIKMNSGTQTVFLPHSGLYTILSTSVTTLYSDEDFLRRDCVLFIFCFVELHTG